MQSALPLRDTGASVHQRDQSWTSPAGAVAAASPGRGAAAAAVSELTAGAILAAAEAGAVQRASPVPVPEPAVGPGPQGAGTPSGSVPNGLAVPAGAAEPGGETRVVVIREGCPACAQEAKEAPGALVLSMKRSRGGEWEKLNVRANPFPIINGKQSRGDVVRAVERMLSGEPVLAVAGRAGLLPHSTYVGPQMAGLDDAIWEEVERLAALVLSGKRLFLRCGSGCHCMCEAVPKGCHADAWRQALLRRVAGQPPPPRQSADLDLASDAVHGSRGKLLLDLFGGDQPVVAVAAARNGYKAARLDTCLDAELGDVANPKVMLPWARECRAGRVLALKSDLPCQSFTCLRCRPVAAGKVPAPPLRSRARLPDLPETPPEWRAYMAKHEGFVATTFDLGTDVILRPKPIRGRFIAEGPLDRGNPNLIVNGTKVYRAAYADHAPLELHPRVQRFLAETGARVVYAFQCACRGLFQKASALIADAETAEALEPLTCLPCVHSEHEEEAVGDDAAGNSNSCKSRVYPAVFAEAITMAVTGSTAAEVEALVKPCFLETVRAAAAEGRLHVAHQHRLAEAEAAADGDGGAQA